MEQTNINKTIFNAEKTATDLFRLGWSSFFSTQLDNRNRDSTPARIIGVRKNIYLVSRGHEEESASLAGRFFNDPETAFPVVGDWVLLQGSVIISLLPRINVLSRKASGGRTRKTPEMHTGEQTIAANLDMVFIVCGMDRDFNPRRIERYLTLVYNCGIEPAVILTKSDLHQNPDECIQEAEAVAFGVPVYPVSANDDSAVVQLKTLLSTGRTAALVGSSGAGKSTLINRLYGEEIRTTCEVGTRVGKGKHTTTTRDLIVLPSGGMVIDNPGIREIALSMDIEGGRSVFSDIEAYAQSCRFSDCTHTHEPGCKVLEAVSDGKIPVGRLNNYQKLGKELSYQNQREHKSASRLEKERWKSVSLKVKAIKKRKQ